MYRQRIGVNQKKLWPIIPVLRVDLSDDCNLVEVSPILEILDR